MMSQAARIDFHYVHGYFPEDDEFEEEDEFEEDEDLDDDEFERRHYEEPINTELEEGEEPEFADPERESPWLEDLL